MRPAVVGCWLTIALLCQGATITITNETLPRTPSRAAAQTVEAWQGKWLEIINGLRARQGKAPLLPDPLLSQGAAAQAQLVADTPAVERTKLPTKLLRDALWQAGVFDGNPVWRVVALPGGVQIQANHPAFAAVADLEGTHLGIGAVRRGSTHWVVLTAVQRRVELIGARPGPFAPYANLWLRGRVMPGNRNPRLLLTPPAGQVQTLPLKLHDDLFEHLLELGAERGRYMAEIMVDGSMGPAVAALFPLDVGNAPPAQRQTQSKSVAGMSLSAMRAQLLELVNADRAKHGLAPLQLSAGFNRMAQGHSEDMAQHKFFAHISPRTGDLVARAKQAGLPEQTLGENIATAGSLEEAEENLMASPGHRAMLLSEEMRYVGFGVVVGGAGSAPEQLWVTQNFGTKGP